MTICYSWLLALLICIAATQRCSAFCLNSGALMRRRIAPQALLAKAISKPAVEFETDEADTESFSGWAAEEIEIQRQEKLQRIKEIEEDGEYVPPYLRAVFAALDEKVIEEETPASKLPIIAVIGRPNTGKSTIVNRLTQSFKDGAIVHDEPGITRDRTYRTGFWNDFNFQVVDTGGIVFEDTSDIFAHQITHQALLALKEASAAIFVCDGQEGLTTMDITIADWLRKNCHVPLYLAINKCESHTTGLTQAMEFWNLGMGNPYPVSGIHGNGLGDILDEITSHDIVKISNVLKDNSTNVALVGRPNVGKSSLFNRILGEERSIVSTVAGTTRDAIDSTLARGNLTYRFVDTAGIRKRGKVYYGPEFFMVNRAFKAIRRAEVVILMLDAVTGMVDQDRVLAQRIADEGRACVIALNKWDAIDAKDDKSYMKAVDNVRHHLSVLRWADIVPMSATTGQRAEKLFASVDRSAAQFGRRISTSILNEIVNDATLWMAPPTIKARSGRIYYCIQVSTAPPTIVFFVNDPDLFTDNYQRFLERKIRDGLNFEGTPIKMIFRGKSLRDVGRAAKKGAIGAVTSGVLQTTMGTGSSAGARAAAPDSDTENGVSAGSRGKVSSGDSGSSGNSGSGGSVDGGEKVSTGKKRRTTSGRDGISKKSIFSGSGSIKRPADRSELKRFRPKK